MFKAALGIAFAVNGFAVISRSASTVFCQGEMNLHKQRRLGIHGRRHEEG